MLRGGYGIFYEGEYTDGRVNLGMSYGSVLVADLTIEQAQEGPAVMQEMRWANFLNPDGKRAGAAR